MIHSYLSSFFLILAPLLISMERVEESQKAPEILQEITSYNPGDSYLSLLPGDILRQTIFYLRHKGEFSTTTALITAAGKGTDNVFHEEMLKSYHLHEMLELNTPATITFISTHFSFRDLFEQVVGHHVGSGGIFIRPHRKLFLTYLKNPKKFINSGDYPFQLAWYALQECEFEIAEKALHIDAQKNSEESLLSRSIRVNSDKYMLLHRACRYGADHFYPTLQKIIILLLKSGYDINRPDKNGDTPLALAAQLSPLLNVSIANIATASSNRLALIEFLLKQKADPKTVSLQSIKPFLDGSFHEVNPSDINKYHPIFQKQYRIIRHHAELLQQLLTQKKYHARQGWTTYCKNLFPCSLL